MSEAPNHVFAALRDAVNQAKADDADLEFTETSRAIAAIFVNQLHVKYKGGNEYISLDKLYELLQKCTTSDKAVRLEFRGRGREPDEVPTLVADLDIEGEYYQVIYHLPGA